MRAGLGMILLVLLICTSCISGTADDASGATAAPVGDGTENAAAQFEVGDPPPQESAEERQIVIWAPEFWGANDETPAGQVVGNTVAQFEQRHDRAKVEIHTKAETGSADMLNTLRSAQRVAPTILPDAILIDTQDIWQLAELGLAKPLTETLDIFEIQFYPFADASVHYNGDSYGIPYAVDLLHASLIDPAAPALPGNWDDLFAGERRYFFPAAGRDGNLSLLLQYAGMGGDISETATAVDLEPLVILYEFYAAGVAGGIIPADNVELGSLESTLKQMDANGPDLYDTSATLQLQKNEAPVDGLFAPAPTMSGRPVSMAQTWAFVIITDDPGQRTRILDLVQLLLEPSVQGDWSKFARFLPTTAEAADTWDASQPYSGFLLTLLQSDETHAVPNGRTFAELLNDIQVGQQAVLSGQMTPEDAANSVRPAP